MGFNAWSQPNTDLEFKDIPIFLIAACYSYMGNRSTKKAHVYGKM